MENSITYSPEDLVYARQALAIKEKWLEPFSVEDPFNGLSLQGFLSRKPDHRYGTLVFTHVAGKPARQVIFATPKLHYPFDRQGHFWFPAATRIEIYEKLDGTNVLAYRYRDSADRLYTTYKLRLCPVLRNGRFGAFLDMWREILETWPRIRELPEINGCSISCELYGARNEHLIVYEEQLRCAVLFGIDANTNPVPLSALKTLGVPVVNLYGTLTADKDPVAEYNKIRTALEEQNRSLEDGRISGSEGTVWYVTTTKGEVFLFKCKPESVEAIHWAGGINKKAVDATCWNLLETCDTLDYQSLLPLLLEEYGEEEIVKFKPHIDDCIETILDQLAFRKRVLEEYAKTGSTITEDKGRVMRQLAGVFSKAEMRRVYTIISRWS